MSSRVPCIRGIQCASYCSRSCTKSFAEPPAAGLLGVVLVGERLTPFAAAGSGLAFAGLALVSLSAAPSEDLP